MVGKAAPIDPNPDLGSTCNPSISNVYNDLGEGNKNSNAKRHSKGGGGRGNGGAASSRDAKNSK